MFSYCGLSVRSEFPLKITCNGVGEPDFTFRLLSSQDRLSEQKGWLLNSTFQDGTPWLSIAARKNGYLLRFHGLADFRLSKDGRIECYPLEGTPTETIRHLLLDQVLPMALAQQGRIVLHGGSVQTARGAIVILGETGWGKSTLTAALTQAGCRLLTDDCLLLEERGGQYYCVPSYPSVRLWPDSVTSLFGDEDRSSPVAHYSDKRRLDADDVGFIHAKGAVPLWRVYSLASPEEAAGAETTAISPVRGKAALMKLTESSFLLDPSDRLLLAQRFHAFGRLAASIRLRKLTIPRDYAALPVACAAILADD